MWSLVLLRATERSKTEIAPPAGKREVNGPSRGRTFNSVLVGQRACARSGGARKRADLRSGDALWFANFKTYPRRRDSSLHTAARIS